MQVDHHTITKTVAPIAIDGGAQSPQPRWNPFCPAEWVGSRHTVWPDPPSAP